MRTNIGRFFTFGRYLDDQPKVHPLVCEDDGPITALSYSVMAPEKVGICKIGAHCSTWASPRRMLISDMDRVYSSNQPPNFPGDGFYKSISVPLEDVVAIRVAGLESDRGFTALLLYYSDGRCEALGDVDLSKDLSDYINAPIELQVYIARASDTARSTFRTVFRTARGDYPWPTGLEVSRPSDDSWNPWPTTGTAKWTSDCNRLEFE